MPHPHLSIPTESYRLAVRPCGLTWETVAQLRIGLREAEPAIEAWL